MIQILDAKISEILTIWSLKMSIFVVSPNLGL